MPYTHTTLAQLNTQLAARLHDSGYVFWASAELDLYIAEALRTFSALSAFWRERGTFNTVNGTAFYDLSTQMAATLGYTVSDRDLAVEIEYHLQEPITVAWAGAWAGTEQFTLTEITNALQHRRNQFLAETGMIVTSSTVLVNPPPATGRVPLNDDIIAIRRLNWVSVNNAIAHLWRMDEWEANCGIQNWALNPASPIGFSVLAPPPLQVQLIPIPIDAGTLSMVAVETGAALTPTVSETTLGVPDDWCWPIKWGALADLLGKDGPARDPWRAQFCEARYQLGVQLAKMASCIVQVQLQGVQLFVNSIEEEDAFAQNWQNLTTAQPTDICTCGYNLVACRPIPDGVYSLTFDVVKKAPVAAGNLEIGREQLDAILDYAEHLAAFKMSGAEFQATFRQADNFIKQSLAYNDRLNAAAKNIFPAAEQSQREKTTRPYATTALSLGTNLPQPPKKEG